MSFCSKFRESTGIPLVLTGKPEMNATNHILLLQKQDQLVA